MRDNHLTGYYARRGNCYTPGPEAGAFLRGMAGRVRVSGASQ